MLTIKKTEKPLCIVTEGASKGTIVYYDDKTSTTPTLLKKKQETEITTETGKFFPIPTLSTRHSIFISGPSGVGKSTFIAEYVKTYCTIFPNNEIRLFSRIINDKGDPLYKMIQDDIIDQIPLNEELYKNPIQLSDLKDTLVIFDDIENIEDPDIAYEVRKLQNDILHLGRHENTYCISTSHLGMDKDSTKVLLNEAQSLVLYPRGGNPNMVRNVLKIYAGLDRKQTDKIMNCGSRWVFINKCYPMYVITEKKIYLL